VPKNRSRDLIRVGDRDGWVCGICRDPARLVHRPLGPMTISAGDLTQTSMIVVVLMAGELGWQELQDLLVDVGEALHHQGVPDAVDRLGCDPGPQWSPGSPAPGSCRGSHPGCRSGTAWAGWRPGPRQPAARLPIPPSRNG
jgi:hypothetical protein